MHRYLLIPLALLATPLAAQQRAIAPTRSPLFISAALPVAPTDSVTPHAGVSTLEGSLLGGLGGFLAGLGLAQVVEAKNPCNCDDPGLDRAITYSLSGLLIGAVLGGMMASR
jgi:hypothetical protein